MPHTEQIKNLLNEISVRSIDAGQGNDIERELYSMVNASTQPKGTTVHRGTWSAENGYDTKRLWQVKNGDLHSVTKHEAVEKLKAGEVIMYESVAGPIYMSAKEYDGMMYLQCMTADHAANLLNNSENYKTVVGLNLPEPSLLERIINAICEFFNAGKREVCEEWDMAHTLENIQKANKELGDVREKVQAEENKEANKRLQEEAKVEKKNNERIKLENERIRAHAEMIENNLKEMPNYAKANGLSEKINDFENAFVKKCNLGNNAHKINVFGQNGFSFDVADKQGFMGQKFEGDVSKYDLAVIAACAAGVSNIAEAMRGKGVGSVHVNGMVNRINEGRFDIKEYKKGIENAEKYLGTLDPLSPEAFRIGEVYGKFAENGSSVYSLIYQASSANSRDGLSQFSEYDMPKHIKNLLDMQQKVRDGLKALNNLADDGYYQKYPQQIKSSLQTVAKGMMAYEMLTSLGKMSLDAREEFLKNDKKMAAYSNLERELDSHVGEYKNLSDRENVMAALTGTILIKFQETKKELSTAMQDEKETVTKINTPGNEKQPEQMVPGVK